MAKLALSLTALLGAGLWLTAAGGREARGDEPHQPKEHTMTRRTLTPAEERVIRGKATEPPFTGAYVDHHEEGVYRCRQCGVPLFASDAKFDSRSGWPAFDQALPGAVREVPDRDGMRTEIVCARCGGHLGHVFRGEGFTGTDTRYCVNSISLAFTPAAETPAAEQALTPPPSTADAGPARAYFAGGCFWGVEHLLQQAPGVISVESGYMGGHVASPSYEHVCTGRTGHAETVRVSYDPARISYRALAKLFFEIHDPTQVNRQGPDHGEQYRSAIFVTSDDERRTIQGLIRDLKARGFDVATTVEDAAPDGDPAGFWPAEAYHQDYYQHKGTQPYCHRRVKRFGE